MASFKVKTYNKIAQVGLDKLPDEYSVSDVEDNPDAIILRSYDLHEEPIADSVLAIGRAGAGVNNIPVDAMAEKGIVVFNAPGANANSVKELVIAGMLLASRNIPAAIEYTSNLSSENMKENVEAGKKQYAGSELSGKTIGVIGLGAIGCRVANSAYDLGMETLGYDPTMTVENALQLVPNVERVIELEELVARSDFITPHIPLLDATKGLISSELISMMKSDAVLLNFSRDAIVDESAVVRALSDNKLGKYVTDFPNPTTLNQQGVISLPHLGASTEEAEDNCAIMVAETLKEFLENGNIRHSVNFPNIHMRRKGEARLCVAHKNEPGVVGEITKILGDNNINIIELINKSRGNVAYTILDLETKDFDENILNQIKSNKSVLSVRTL